MLHAMYCMDVNRSLCGDGARVLKGNVTDKGMVQEECHKNVVSNYT